MVRWLFTAVIVLFALLFWYITFVVPMISAAAPAVIAIALSVVAFFIWPRRKNRGTLAKP